MGSSIALVICVRLTSEAMLAQTKMNGQAEGTNKPEVKDELSNTHNTYQLGPDVGFPRDIVARMTKEVVDSLLLGREYEPEFCRQASRLMTDVLKARVKSLQLKRYRIITHAIISSVGDPNFYLNSLCLWEPALDTCVLYEFCNGSIAAAVSVFGIYQS
ncbi:Tctex1 domain-containing protein 1-A [Taenia crassiceps]|uniref:Tctex1 domain-containing protein 1-A n=1 Tax=Taenia crassiceps TaxID=6207 RepID=A0ABR4QCY8_9CEST